VQVLEHEDGLSSRPQLTYERRDDLVRHHPVCYDLLELAAGSLGYRKQRPERPRCEERIATAPEDPRRLLAFLAEPSQERRLPHSCLASDENDASVRARLHSLEGFGETRELAGALEQLTRGGGDVGGRDPLHIHMVNLGDQRFNLRAAAMSHESRRGVLCGSKPRRSRSPSHAERAGLHGGDQPDPRHRISTSWCVKLWLDPISSAAPLFACMKEARILQAF
jgi:hypothetical protein